MTLTKIASTGVEDSLRWVLGANGTSDYTFTGPGLTGTVNDPTIYLTRGHTYIFQNNSGGHPFYIKTSIANGGTNDAYNTGVTNNGGGNGTEIIFTVPHDSPDILYYQCSSHSSMAGQFNIAGSVADGSISTAKLADDAVTNDKLANSVVASIAANTAKTSNATHTGDVTGSTSLTIANGAVTAAKIATNTITADKIASNAVNTGEIADGAVTAAKIASQTITADKIANDAVNTGEIADSAVTGAKIASGAVSLNKLASDSVGTAKIIDQAVTLAKLPHGTSSNDGKFLRANNGADPTFESLPASGLSNVVEDTTPQLGGDLQSNGHDIDLADGDKITLGNSADLQIEHDGGHSYITDGGTGDLNINSSRVRLKSADNSELMLQATANGGVEAYHNNIEMIETFDSSNVGDSSTGSGVKTIGNTGAGTRSNHGYYCYQGSNLVAKLTNHGSGPEGALTLYNQGSPKISMNGTNGTLKLHGSSGYIQFGDTNTASHRLDDYEEGTWTPSNATTGFTTTQGYYLKIGDWVWWNLRVAFQSNSSGVYSYVDGFPFTTISQSHGSYQFGGYATYSTRGVWYVLIGNNASRIYMYDSSGNQLNHADFSGKELRVQGWCKVQ